MIDLNKINLRKDAVIDLKKKSGLGEAAKAQVVLALDFSISMDGLYRNGTVQDTVERILPFGLAFDDNGEVDFFLFENGSRKLNENITVSNLDGYIQKRVIGKYNMGGTNYAPVLKQIYSEFSAKKGGFLGFGSKPAKMDIPVYVIFITDGNNSDKSETETIIKEMSKQGFFIQFVGIGNERFEFLSKLDTLSGTFIDNVNFLKINNIKTCTDSELYSGLMAEYPGWVQLAKQSNLIV